MDCTQVLDASDYENPPSAENTYLAAFLVINGVKNKIFNKENLIGREEPCNVRIDSLAVSGRHAVIEVDSVDSHVIYDLGSRNKTKLDKMMLKPHIRYHLRDGETLTFGNVMATYEYVCQEDNSCAKFEETKDETLRPTVIPESPERPTFVVGVVPETPVKDPFAADLVTETSNDLFLDDPMTKMSPNVYEAETESFQMISTALTKDIDETIYDLATQTFDDDADNFTNANQFKDDLCNKDSKNTFPDSNFETAVNDLFHGDIVQSEVNKTSDAQVGGKFNINDETEQQDETSFLAEKCVPLEESLSKEKDSQPNISSQVDRISSASEVPIDRNIIMVGTQFNLEDSRKSTTLENDINISQVLTQSFFGNTGNYQVGESSRSLEGVNRSTSKDVTKNRNIYLESGANSELSISELLTQPVVRDNKTANEPVIDENCVVSNLSEEETQPVGEGFNKRTTQKLSNIPGAECFNESNMLTQPFESTVSSNRDTNREQLPLLSSVETAGACLSGSSEECGGTLDTSISEMFTQPIKNNFQKSPRKPISDCSDSGERMPDSDDNTSLSDVMTQPFVRTALNERDSEGAAADCRPTNDCNLTLSEMCTQPFTGEGTIRVKINLDIINGDQTISRVKIPENITRPNHNLQNEIAPDNFVLPANKCSKVNSLVVKSKDKCISGGNIDGDRTTYDFGSQPIDCTNVQGGDFPSVCKSEIELSESCSHVKAVEKRKSSEGVNVCEKSVSSLLNASLNKSSLLSQMYSEFFTKDNLPEKSDNANTKLKLNYQLVDALPVVHNNVEQKTNLCKFQSGEEEFSEVLKPKSNRRTRKISSDSDSSSNILSTNKEAQILSNEIPAVDTNLVHTNRFVKELVSIADPALSNGLTKSKFCNSKSSGEEECSEVLKIKSSNLRTRKLSSDSESSLSELCFKNKDLSYTEPTDFANVKEVYFSQPTTKSDDISPKEQKLNLSMSKLCDEKESSEVPKKKRNLPTKYLSTAPDNSPEVHFRDTNNCTVLPVEGNESESMEPLKVKETLPDCESSRETVKKKSKSRQKKLSSRSDEQAAKKKQSGITERSDSIPELKNDLNKVEEGNKLTSTRLRVKHKSQLVEPVGNSENCSAGKVNSKTRKVGPRDKAGCKVSPVETIPSSREDKPSEKESSTPSEKSLKIEKEVVKENPTKKENKQFQKSRKKIANEEVTLPIKEASFVSNENPLKECYVSLLELKCSVEKKQGQSNDLPGNSSPKETTGELTIVEELNVKKNNLRKPSKCAEEKLFLDGLNLAPLVTSTPIRCYKNFKKVSASNTSNISSDSRLKSGEPKQSVINQQSEIVQNISVTEDLGRNKKIDHNKKSELSSPESFRGFTSQKKSDSNKLKLNDSRESHVVETDPNKTATKLNSNKAPSESKSLNSLSLRGRRNKKGVETNADNMENINLFDAKIVTVEEETLERGKRARSKKSYSHYGVSESLEKNCKSEIELGASSKNKKAKISTDKCVVNKPLPTEMRLRNSYGSKKVEAVTPETTEPLKSSGVNISSDVNNEEMEIESQFPRPDRSRRKKKIPKRNLSTKGRSVCSDESQTSEGRSIDSDCKREVTGDQLCEKEDHVSDNDSSKKVSVSYSYKSVLRASNSMDATSDRRSEEENTSCRSETNRSSKKTINKNSPNGSERLIQESPSMLNQCSANSSNSSNNGSSNRGRNNKRKSKIDTVGDLNDDSKSRSTKQKCLSPDDLQNTSSESSRILRTPTRKSSSLNVMFTGYSDQKMMGLIKRLGGSVVEDPFTCTVLVTDKVRRTIKFLCSLAKGCPIVSPQWLHACQKSDCFVDSHEHTLRDPDAEAKFNFNLKTAIDKAKTTPLLDGWSVHVTASVKPPPEEIKSIIELSGGKFLQRAPARWPQNSFVISTLEDKRKWNSLKKNGTTPSIFNTEILLTGILQQELNLNLYKIK